MVKRLELDWVVVSVHTVRRLVAVGLVVILAAALLAVGYRLLHQPPPVQARKAIERAESVRKRLDAEQLPDVWKNELAQADSQLKLARDAYAEERWEEARDAADSVRRRCEILLGAGEREVVGVGQVVSLEGRVSVQRAGKSDWSGAHERQPLFNGDFVRTGSDGVAEILFSDGTLYRMDPGSLLEISQRQQSSRKGDVSMVVGEINVSTTDRPAQVTAGSTKAVIDKDSRVKVGIRQDDKSTVVAAYNGAAHIVTDKGSEVSLGPNELVQASADGALSEKRRLPDPPQLLEPIPNASFELGTDRVIRLRWKTPDGVAASYLQVARSRLFLPTTLDVDNPGRNSSSATLRPLQRGIYFWRVASQSDDGLMSEWTAPGRFRVVGGGGPVGLADALPPPLEVEPLKQLGHLFIVEGQTEPGATLTINGEEVEVDGDGHFRKAIEATQAGWNDLAIVATDPAGNQTNKQERVFVEVY